MILKRYLHQYHLYCGNPIYTIFSILIIIYPPHVSSMSFCLISVVQQEYWEFYTEIKSVLLYSYVPPQNSSVPLHFTGTRTDESGVPRTGPRKGLYGKGPWFLYGLQQASPEARGVGILRNSTWTFTGFVLIHVHMEPHLPTQINFTYQFCGMGK